VPAWPGGLESCQLALYPQVVVADTHASSMLLGDDAFLEDLQRRAARYFIDLAHPQTGLMPDRAPADGSGTRENCASVATCGFGLTALAIAEGRGWLSHTDALARAERTLRTLVERVPHKHGFLLHWVTLDTVERAWDSEYSTIDTALCLSGALAAGLYFGGTVAELAEKFFDRIDWPRATVDGLVLHHGWRGGTREAISWRWDQFAEHLGMYQLAMQAPTAARRLPRAAWHAWRREPWCEYGDRRFLHHPPLFVHQFPQAWLDFRYFDDAGVNYFANARVATLAQRDYCRRELRVMLPTYGDDMWGLTASDGPERYVAWGAPPIDGRWLDPLIDGTVVPCAPAGSMPFAPLECAAALREMYRIFRDTPGWGPYGFADALNPLTGWTARDVIGIDQGITLLMIENHRTQDIWRLLADYAVRGV
jgi:hypothetical protein